MDILIISGHHNLHKLSDLCEPSVRSNRHFKQDRGTFTLNVVGKLYGKNCGVLATGGIVASMGSWLALL